MVSQTLADRVREIRVECFGEQGAALLAAVMKIPARRWAKYEGGATIPAVVILRFIDLTGANPIYLLRGEGPRYSDRLDPRP